MKMRAIAIFIIVVVIGMILAGCCFLKDNKRYPDVAVGEEFSSFGFDGYCRKLPNDYMIEVEFGGGNTVYKINNYEDVMLGAVKIEENVEYYFCIENMVFLKSVDKNGTTTYFSLDTTGITGENLTVYVDETQLLNDYEMEKIDWDKARP